MKRVILATVLTLLLALGLVAPATAASYALSPVDVGLVGTSTNYVTLDATSWATRDGNPARFVGVQFTVYNPAGNQTATINTSTNHAGFARVQFRVGGNGEWVVCARIVGLATADCGSYVVAGLPAGES